MMDIYNFMKVFNSYIYSYAQRPLVEKVETLLTLPTPEEMELQKIYKSFKVNTKTKVKSRSIKSIRNNKIYCWRQRQKRRLLYLVDSLDQIEKEQEKHQKLVEQVKVMQNELILLRNNYPDECQSYFNEYKRLEEDMMIVISHQSEEPKANLEVDSLNASFDTCSKTLNMISSCSRSIRKLLSN
uniref:BZIP domain-containing protein n=1 Tax=Acrobeloides nanus TaxID=290746 RepID=A0A914D120_9BILA